MAREAGFMAMRGHGLLPHVPEDIFIANVRVTEELNHLVALVRADEREQIIATQPTPEPLTNDPLQGAVDWLLQADGEYFCTATVQHTLRIGYNRAKRLCDTAKERAEAAHGITAAPEKGQP